MVAQPILRWTYGERFVGVGVTLTVLLQAGAVLAILAPQWGWQRTSGVLICVGILAWLVEYFGSTTGFPFGSYQYTDRLQPQLEGVPLVIPLAWLMMLPPSWAVAAALTRALTSRWRLIAFVLIAAMAFTAWDLFLDPQMVGWGFWRWQQNGEYFGIPLQNFAGWLLASSAITTIVYTALRPPELPIRPLLLIYAITLALESVGLAVFWDMVGPAAAGTLGMGSLLLLAVQADRAQAERKRR
jgi:putative membrane protein